MFMSPQYDEQRYYHREDTGNPYSVEDTPAMTSRREERSKTRRITES